MSRPRVIPEWVIELEKVFEPYMEYCTLAKNAPQEAVEAFEKVKQWYWEQPQ